MRSMCLRNKSMLVMGDFNDDYNISNSSMKRVIQTLHLTQLTNKATRITSTSSTTIDLMITNNPNFISHSEVIPCTVGDHEQLTVTINVKKEKVPLEIRKYRSLDNYSPNIFCNLIINESHVLNGILDTDCVNNQVFILTRTFIECLDACAPYVNKEIKRPPAPWIDIETKEAMKVRDRLHMEFKRDRQNSTVKQNYVREKKKVKALLADKKKNYYRGEFAKNKGNIKGTWNVIRKIIPENKTLGMVEDPNEDLEGKAEDFNKYFSQIGKDAYNRAKQNINETVSPNNNQVEGPRANSNLNQLNQNINQSNKFRPQPIDINMLILIIKHLKPTNSFGSVGIPYRFLIDSLPAIVFYVLIIINTSIVTGVFPDTWKYPYVIPIFKGGDRDNVGNYRPICLLPILSKILERVIANQLTNYLESNKLLVNNQHGFRPNLSTETALHKITNKIYENIENKKLSLLIMLDLSKAFDSVHHQTLLEKFEELNIDSFWFNSYLKNRSQSVRCGSVVSSPIEIEYGVPQGSILGPIQFLIYVNDVVLFIIGCLLVMYADDMQCLITGEPDDIEDMIDRAKKILQAAKAYFNRIGLLLNENKTQFIFFGSRQYISRIPDNIEIKLNNVSIKQSHIVKNLGIHMDRCLTFNIHIDEIIKKVTGTLLYLNRVWDRFEPECRIMVIQSLVLSILNYCLPIYGSTCKTQINRIQKIQNFAAKVAIGGARKFDHVTPIFEKLKWLKMEDKYLYSLCLLVFKVKHNIIPDWLFSFPTVGQSHGDAVNTRFRDAFYIPRVTTGTGARSLNVIGPREWNKLPEDIKQCTDIQSFKNKLTKLLLDK